MPVPPLTASPNPDHLGGGPVRTKRQVAVCRAGYEVDVAWVLRDQTTGGPINLTNFDLVDNQAADDGPPTLRCHLRELAGGCDGVTTLNCSIQTASLGQVRMTVPANAAALPGVMMCEFFADGTAPRFVAETLLWIEPSARSTSSMPSRADLRTSLRDLAGDNELLDGVDFDDTELAAAISWVVDVWNGIQPTSMLRYSTQTFPYRAQWLRGATIYLFEVAAEHYVRNSLPYQARGGLAGDDKAKYPPYLQRAAAYRAEWLKDLNDQKIYDSVAAGGLGIVPGVM